MDLRKFRKEQNLSQDNFARKMDVSLSMYQKVETKQIKASRGFMEKLKKAYPYASIDELFFSHE